MWRDLCLRGDIHSYLQTVPSPIVSVKRRYAKAHNSRMKDRISKQIYGSTVVYYIVIQLVFAADTLNSMTCVCVWVFG